MRGGSPGWASRASRHVEGPEEATGADWPLHPAHLPRSFLLLWLALVYGRELLFMYGIDNPKKLYVIGQCFPLAAEPRACPPDPVLSLLDVSPLLLVAFTLLLVAQGVLLWVSLSRRLPDRALWPCFFLQGAVLLAIGVIAQQVYVVFSLYLALLLGAIVLLQRARPVALVAAGYGITLIVAGVKAWAVATPLTAVTALWNATDVLALLLFAAGYLALYTRQAQAHSQVVAYAARVEELTLLAERQRLARELHDTLAQGVVGLTLQLETVDALLDDGRTPRAQEIVQEALQRARATLATARGAIDDLRAQPPEPPGYPRAGRVAALHDDLRRFTVATRIPCQAELESLSLLSARQQGQVAHIITEGLSNVARHARARHVWVQAAQEDGWLIVDLRDAVVGFDPALVATLPGHYGLQGLRERAQLLGGHLELRSAPGEGTRLRVSIPWKETQRASRRTAAAGPRTGGT